MARTPSLKQLEKLTDKRIEKLYYAACNGVTIPMMSIPAIFAAGRVAVAAGLDDAGVTAAIVAKVKEVGGQFKS